MSDFRDRLRAILPDPPATADWAERATTIGRTRRRRVALTGMGGALAAAAVVIALLDPAGGARLAVPAAPTGTHTVPAPLTCPGSSEDYAKPSPADPVTLPHGAVSLQWCTYPGDPQMTEYAPPEPLTRDLDAWVDTFNTLRPLGRDVACTSDWSIPAMAVLGYPDGTTRRVAGMSAGCGTIGGRQGFDLMRQRTLEALVAQRGADEPHAPDQADKVPGLAPCSASTSTIPAHLPWVRQVAVCTRDHQGTITARLVDQAAVQPLLVDLVAHRVKAADDVWGDGPQMHLRQANGEFLPLQFNTERGVWTFREAGQAWTWAPDATSRSALAGASPASSGSSTTPYGQTAPAPGTPIGSEGTVPACQLPATVTTAGLPSGATQIWFCSAWRFGPAEPLTTKVDEFVASTTGGIEPCFANPADESFVAVYPDGTSVRLQMPAATCHPNPGAITAFVRLMGEQRSQPGWTPAVTEPPQKLCLWDTWRPLMPMSPHDATEVRYCHQKTSGEITDEQVAGLPLTSSERATVLSDLIAHSSAGGTPPTQPGEVELVLLRSNGETLWVREIAGQNHRLSWEDASGAWMVWTPGPDSQAILADYAQR